MPVAHGGRSCSWALYRYKDPALGFHQRYSCIVGSLGYLVTMTRPDLAWAHTQLSKYVQFSGKNHMLAARHVLSYLDGTWNQKIRYSLDSYENPNVLWGLVDADWAGGDTDTSRSHTGYILMMNGGSISWPLGRVGATILCDSETCVTLHFRG